MDLFGKTRLLDMTHNYNAKINYYSFLSGMPRGWQLVMSRTLGVVPGDIINVIEVDGSGTPTGSTMQGTVLYDVTNNDFTYASDSTLVYVVPN